MIETYIDKYGKRLYGLCLYLAKNSSDADDLYQETWLKVLKNLSKYDSSLEFEGWLTKICVNTYRNILRKIKRSPFLIFSNNEEKDKFIESLPYTEEDFIKDEYFDLHESINKLPEKLRITVILFYFKDMEASKTAEIMEVPIGTVKSRLNKARKLLKEDLKNETDLQI